MKILVVGRQSGKSSVASSLVSLGHRVVVADPWNKDTPPSSAFEETFTVELSDQAAVISLFENVIDTLDGLDALIFTAANDVAVDVGSSRGIKEVPNDKWKHLTSGLLYGGFYCTQAALRFMVAQHFGRIIYLCADGAVDGKVHHVAISAVNSGLLALSSSIAASAFRNGTTVNALLLGEPYDLSCAPPPKPDTADEEVLAYSPNVKYKRLRLQELHALHERTGMGWSQSAAAMLDHLCSDSGGVINGSTLRLDNIGEHYPLIRWSY